MQAGPCISGERGCMGLSGIDMSVNIAGVSLKNPVMTASGTFSTGDSGRFYDLSRLGAVVTKGVSLEPWEGNPTPRIAESYGGMLNSIGLQNPGVDKYIEEELPVLRQFGVPVIANVAGKSAAEYCGTVEKLNETDVSMLEINISCRTSRKAVSVSGQKQKLRRS